MDYLMHNYFPVPKNNFVINIASQNDKIIEKSIAQIKMSIDLSFEIGSLLYTFHPGFLSDPISENKKDTNYDFIFSEEKIKNNNYEISFERMVKALKHIVNYAKNKKVKIAIETEGSRENFLAFMYQPFEYERLFKIFKNNDLGISLNLGHLNLASKEFNFPVTEFINVVKDRIVAIEMSHNDGIDDQHLPLRINEWYWPIIFDNRFKNAYKIMEFRYTTVDEIKDNINLYHRMRKQHG